MGIKIYKIIEKDFVFIKNTHYNGSYESLRDAIYEANLVVNSKILPFRIDLGNGYELIFSNKLTHPDANIKHTFFIFNVKTKELVKSSHKLKHLFDIYDTIS